MRGLLTIGREAEYIVILHPDDGEGGRIALVELEGVDGDPVIRHFDVGPFDTGLDVVSWLLRQMIDLGALKPM